MPATIGLQLDPLTDLYGWQRIAESKGAAPWYFAAETVAAARRNVEDPAPVKAAEVSRVVADHGYPATGNLFYKGAEFGEWSENLIGLGSGLTPVTNLFTQARLYTFLSYRRGLQSALSIHSYTAEQAVHAYMRVALTWVERWPGLTLATTSEKQLEMDELRRDKTKERLNRKLRHEATVSLPFIIEKDLQNLIDRYDHAERSANAPAPESKAVPEGADRALVIAQQLAGRLKLAALEMIKNPTLRPLSAYNIIRADANVHLGGGLARTRLVAGDYVLVTVDEKIRKLLISGKWSQLDASTQENYLNQSPTWRLLLGLQGPEAEGK